jgi:hypothetical protein
MKTAYKGHEITVTREKCMGGWSQLFYGVFRISDGHECASGFSSGSETPREFTTILKERIDAELADADPWGEANKEGVKG